MICAARVQGKPPRERRRVDPAGADHRHPPGCRSRLAFIRRGGTGPRAYAKLAPARAHEVPNVSTKGIEPQRSGTRSVQRAVRHYVAAAERSLARAHRSDVAVHDARQALKKSRAALRLLRPALGRRIYRRENARLREAAHSLTLARDLKALVQTLDSLRRREPALGRDASVAQVSRQLHAQRRSLRRQMQQSPAALTAARAGLHRTRRGAHRWHVGQHGWSILGPAVERIYRVGRRRLRAARASAADSALHDWRKQVKYLCHALQMLEPMGPAEIGAAVQQAHTLSKQLGELHDLSLLAQRARALGGPRTPGSTALLAACGRRAAPLAQRTLALGQRLYRLPPRTLRRQLGGYWRRWRQG
ncbi:MAG: CHAD domain-containing protein [Steroidobacteraceae bacterium]